MNDFDAHVATALAVANSDYLTDDEQAELWLATLPVGTTLTGHSQGVPVDLTVIPDERVQLGATRWTFASAIHYFGPLAVTNA